jgi:hypothetical protein
MLLPMLLLLLLLLLLPPLMLLLPQHICALLRANASDMGWGGMGGEAAPDLERLMTMIKQGLGERAAAHDG